LSHDLDDRFCAEISFVTVLDRAAVFDHSLDVSAIFRNDEPVELRVIFHVYQSINILINALLAGDAQIIMKRSVLVIDVYDKNGDR